MASPRWLHADQQGSIVAVSDASGASIATNRYDEYGIPQASNLGRFQSTGQAWIAELGMYHYKARIYSPTLGRFLQTDPVGYADQINLYAYVGNDPVNGADPTGMCTGSLISNDDGTCRGSGTTIAGAGSCEGNCGGKATLSNDAQLHTGSASTIAGGDVPSAEAGAEVGADIVVNGPSGCWIVCRIARVLGIRSTGLSGEAAVREQFNIGDKTKIDVGGKARYPDGINQTLGTLSEVKNVSRLHFSSRLKAYVAYSQANGLKFHLYIRTSTKLTAPFADLEAAGVINIKHIPGM